MPNLQFIFQSISKIQQASTTMQKRNQNIHRKKVYTLQETLFEKLDGFNIEYTKIKTLFKNVYFWLWINLHAIRRSKSTETITWIGQHEIISVSIPSNLRNKTIFLRDKDP